MKIFESHNKQWGKFITINIGVLYIYWSSTDRSGWMRLFGNRSGIHWKHKDSSMQFSERYGYSKFVTIGNYRFKLI